MVSTGKSIIDTITQSTTGDQRITRDASLLIKRRDITINSDYKIEVRARRGISVCT
jgi:hypothetical protein